MFTKKQLGAILEAHRAWLAGSPSGNRADLSGADLNRAALNRADLTGACLSEADLNRANLSGASLSGADLSEAKLSQADLSGGNLTGADLSGANLSQAGLSRADLSGADLRWANLRGANLRGANLSGASLRGADLSEAKLSPHSVCPEVGSFLAFKRLQDGIIATLRIPEGARRVSSLVDRKCRAEFVEVVALTNPDGTPAGRGVSRHDGATEYVVGQTVRPDDFNDDIRLECAPGIHFFITQAEAEAF